MYGCFLVQSCQTLRDTDTHTDLTCVVDVVAQHQHKRLLVVQSGSSIPLQ